MNRGLPLALKSCRVVFAAILLGAWALPAFSLIIGQPSHGKKSDRRHEIDAMEDTWRSALLSANTTALAGILSDDYMAITPSGTVQSKDETVANLKSGRTHFTSITIFDRKVRFYGSTALVTSLASIEGTTDGGQVSGNYRYTTVYARDAQGKWKIVSFEANRVREPGPHPHNEFH